MFTARHEQACSIRNTGMYNRDYEKIRYTKCHFTIRFTEDTVLPKYKASMLRGGMGEMLLRSCCIRGRDCESCDFEDECLVQRILYSKMEKRPDFMKRGDSCGYVLECEDYRQEFPAGGELNFSLLLFGRTIVYFSQILRAFFALGMQGMGRNNSRFVITGITNSRKEPILSDGQSVLMENYSVMTVGDYIAYRRPVLERAVSAADGDSEAVSAADGDSGAVPPALRLRLRTPLAVKYNGEQLREVNADAFVKAAVRRLYILCCFEGIDITQEDIYAGAYPVAAAQEVRDYLIPRYSNRTDTRMKLSGIEGSCTFDGVTPRLLDILIAGELIHIGKNTSFGFGRYRIQDPRTSG